MSPKLSSIINFSRFAADSAEWKRAGRIVFLIVAVPLFAMFLACEYVGWNLGEDLSPEEGARLQTADPRIVWDSASFSSHYRFKLARVEVVKPDVLVLGQSRMRSLSAGMFAPYSFYNLYRPSYPFSAFTEMLGRIPKDYSPKVIIFDLDFFMFNQKYGDYYYTESAPNAPTSGLRDHINMVRKCFIAIGRDPLLIFASRRTSVHNVPTIGLLPNFIGTGYKADGSYSPRAHGPELQSDLYLGVMWNYDPSFFYCDAMEPKPMAELEEFAREAHARGIALIGVQMPIYGPVLRRFESDSHYGILTDFRRHLADGYFDRLGIVALDYADLPPYNNDPRYYSDAVHGDGVLDGLVILKMATDPRVKALLPNLDTTDLQKQVDEAHEKSEYENLYPN